jgi:hypothetical protein
MISSDCVCSHQWNFGTDPKQFSSTVGSVWVLGPPQVFKQPLEILEWPSLKSLGCGFRAHRLTKLSLAHTSAVRPQQYLKSESRSLWRPRTIINKIGSKSFPDGLELLEFVSDVYKLASPSVKALRDKLTLCARINFKIFLQGPSVREVYETIAAEHPDFIKDVLDIYIKVPALNCFTCSDDKVMNIVQGRCFTCGKNSDRSRGAAFHLQEVSK